MTDVCISSALARGGIVVAIYEYNTQISVRQLNKIEGIIPRQAITSGRRTRRGSTHAACLKAFSSMLPPNVCVLLDVGTVP